MTLKVTAVAILAAATLSVSMPFALAGAGHVHVEPTHGGKIVESASYHVEWVLQNGTLTIYLTDDKGTAVVAKGHTGSVLVVAPSGRKGPFVLSAGDANKMSAAGVPAFPPPANAILTLTDAKGASHQFKLN